MLFRLCTRPEWVNEWTFEVDSCDAGSSVAEGSSSIDGIRDVYKRPCDFGFAVCNGGCEEGCRPAFRVCPADCLQRLGGGIHSVRATAAMDMDIDKAG